MQTAAEKINNYNAASTDLDNMIPEAFNVSENSCATMQRAMTSDLVKNMTERTITAVGGEHNDLREALNAIILGDRSQTAIDTVIDFMEAPVCNTLVNVEMFLERFLIFNREKLCYDNGKSVPNAFYDEDGIPDLKKFKAWVRGKDQAEEVATDSRLTTKLAAIKAELPPKKAKHWMGQFQKAWDIVSSYENLSKREKTYANISQVSYELGHDGLVGIRGILGLDREGELFACENATVDMVDHNLDMYIAANNKGVKKGKDIEYVADNQRYQNTDLFDRKESGLKNMTNLPIESYLATEDEMYALTTWAGKDGALLAALLDVDLVFGDHGGFWVVSSDNQPRTFDIYADGQAGTFLSPDTRFNFIRGFQGSNSK